MPNLHPRATYTETQLRRIVLDHVRRVPVSQTARAVGMPVGKVCRVRNTKPAMLLRSRLGLPSPTPRPPIRRSVRTYGLDGYERSLIDRALRDGDAEF